MSCKVKAPIPPTRPLVVELDLTKLKDKEFRELFCNEKLRWAVAKQVKDIRIHFNWSQQELANKAGCSVFSIINIENFNSPYYPRLSTLLSIGVAADMAFTVRFASHREFLEFIEGLESSPFKVIPLSEDPEFWNGEEKVIPH